MLAIIKFVSKMEAEIGIMKRKIFNKHTSHKSSFLFRCPPPIKTAVTVCFCQKGKYKSFFLPQRVIVFTNAFCSAGF